MNDYTKPEYKNLYKEILKDYQFRFPKFNPIPYPFPRKINDFINNQNQNKYCQTQNMLNNVNIEIKIRHRACATAWHELWYFCLALPSIYRRYMQKNTYI